MLLIINLNENLTRIATQFASALHFASSCVLSIASSEGTLALNNRHTIFI